MEPGIYRNLPASEYHQIDAYSNSRGSKLAQTPAHLQYAIENPGEDDTASLLLGRAFHSSVLEPEKFVREFIVGPKVDKRTKDGKAAWAQFEKEAEGKEILTEDQYKKIGGMTSGVLKCEDARLALLKKTDVELTLIWNDQETGVRCKARLDTWCAGIGFIVDLKSTRCASKEAFQLSVLNFGYYRQAALYLDGARACGLDAKQFLFIAVESEAPFAAACYRIDEASIQIGRDKNRELLALYKSCKESHVWPGYPSEVQDIGLPEWFIKRQNHAITGEIKF